jgi:hypothetical protein
MTNITATQINTPGRRAAAYWYVDGLPEIVFGLLALGWSGFAIIAKFHPGNKWILLSTWLLLYGLFTFLMYRDKKILDFIKARITYPRTGYVQPPEEPLPDQDLFHDMFGRTKPDPLITLQNARPISENVSDFRVRAIVLILLSVNLGMFCRGKWSITLGMTALAALVYVLNRRDVHSYSWWSVIPIALSGLLAATLGLPSYLYFFLPMFILGTWLFARGAWTLIRFLRNSRNSSRLEYGRP